MDRLRAYDLLGLPQGAGEEDIKTAYRDLARKYNEANYEAGPLRQEAAAKMAEINEAFDLLMSLIRTGGAEGTNAPPVPDARGHDNNQSRYPAIRELINTGRVDDALAQLASVPGGAADAEWNFLMGSAYYYKGWLDQALRYFAEAVRLEPGNREYEATLRNLQNSAGGNMQGNPYTNPDPSAQAMSCACNTCSMMCCMDACCSMCGSGC